MLGWFAPGCPLTTREKAWTEWRMSWLAERLDPDRLLRATVLPPTPEFFAGRTPAPSGSASGAAEGHRGQPGGLHSHDWRSPSSFVS